MEYMTVMKGHVPHRGFKDYVAFLPQNLDTTDLIIPSRQLVQDWSSQGYHNLCKGNMWLEGDQYARDQHFMNHPGIALETEEDKAVIMKMLLNKPSLQHMLNSYFCLINNQDFMPEKLDKMLPDCSEIPQDVRCSGMRQIMRMYYSTLLLMLRVAEMILAGQKESISGHDKTAFEETKSGKGKEEPPKRPRSADQVKKKVSGKDENTEESSSDKNKDPFYWVGVDDKSKPFFNEHLTVKALLNWMKKILQNVTYSSKERAKCQTHYVTGSKTELKKTSMGNIQDIGEYSTCVSYLLIPRNVNVGKRIPNLLEHFRNLVGLEMTFCRINTLEGISECRKLRSLLVSKNDIAEIPASMAVLRDTLECLDISINPLKEIPSFLTEFTQLTELRFADTLVRELPQNIGNLKRLKHLEAKSTFVTKLPESFQNLKNLKSLNLHGIPLLNDGKRFTHVITRDFMTDLKNPSRMGHVYSTITEQEKEEMFVKCDKEKSGTLKRESVNALNDLLFEYFPRMGRDTPEYSSSGGIPPQIFACRNLRTLVLRCQAVTSVPDDISRLRRLSRLIIDSNPHLEAISGEVGKLPVKVLALSNCPNLKTPPKEIVAQGMGPTIGYLKRLSQGSVACYRTKLMFVGLGGAGKTSLMRALVSGTKKAKMQQAEEITDGIDITNWTINRSGVNLTYSVWDFAGQTVYYNTHQFFLSDRAVYLLMWNTRLGYEHSGLDFWLSSITCHCPKAPIFVVGTHADKVSKSDLPMDRLQQRFPAISGFHTVSSLSGQGVGDLMENLISTTLSQPYVGERIPEAWLNFERNILSKRQNASLLTWKNLTGLAGTASVHGSEVNQAVRFLHDLGALQHFDNELLRDRVIINPQWIVDVMACVVTVHDNVVKDGRLQHKELGKLWKKYPKELHNWLLHLTEVFDLTFPLPDKDENIVPCLLSQTEPQYDWPKPDDRPDCYETKILYTFEYLPAGLFNRAQVRLYQYSDHSSIWKSGSLLSKNDHLAIVRQTSESQVLVRAFGTRPENILLFVHEVFEGLIAESFVGVHYDYHLPCMECVKKYIPEPTMFSASILRRAVELKAMFLQCHSQFHMLSVSDIQGAMPPDSSSDFDLQLDNTVRELDGLYDEMNTDLFFIYHQNNLQVQSSCQQVNLHKVKKDLETSKFTCNFMSDLHRTNLEDITTAMQNSKLILVCLSNDLVSDDASQRMFKFAREVLQKRLVLLMVGPQSEGFNWQKSSIGLKLTGQIFYNLQRPYQYEEKMAKLKADLRRILGIKMTSNRASPCDAFISYAWTNSNMAVEHGDTQRREGAIGHGDPRKLKEYLHNQGITTWLDIEKTGQNGLFEDIAEGIKQAKVFIACVSDEYVTSLNCQMEFRFAHVVLKLPIILAVVGTGFKWQSTEIGMLSLGYPKVNFQIANNAAHRDILEQIKDRIDESFKREPQNTPPSPNTIDTKQRAFQELYEVAQRKLLRQISSFSDDNDYPRLFVADLNYDSSEVDRASPESETETDEVELQIDEESGPKLPLLDLQTGRFCIKTLCEHEGGWHAVNHGTPVELSGQELAGLWKLSCPYMARVLAILKHSNINLHIISTEEGARLLQMLEKHIQVNQDMMGVYRAVRKYVRSKDEKCSRAGLSRCYMPSGKILWLCAEHQKLPRVSVLSTDKPAPEEPDQEVVTNPEYRLLEELRSIIKEDEFSAGENSTESELSNVPLPPPIPATLQKPEGSRAAAPPPVNNQLDHSMPQDKHTTTKPSMNIEEHKQTPSEPPSGDTMNQSPSKDNTQIENNIDTNMNSTSSANRALTHRESSMSDNEKRKALKKKVSLTFGRSKEANIKGSTACNVM